MKKTLGGRVLQFIKQTWLIYTLALAAGALTVIGLAIFKTPEYSSQVEILVSQRYTISDPYTATKSALAVRDNLADVIHTSLFLNQVVGSKLVNLDELMKLPEEERRKTWEKMVVIATNSNSPIMDITGYDKAPGQAEAIANAVSQTIIEHGDEYHSSPDTITLQITDAPLTSRYPTRPNLLTNGLAAALFGALAGAVILFLRPSSPLPWVKRTPINEHPTTGQDVVDVTAEPIHRHGEETLPPPQYNVLGPQNFHHNLPKKEDLPQHTPRWK
jgi:capsular polysaccharide biosynthesis protein